MHGQPDNSSRAAWYSSSHSHGQAVGRDVLEDLAVLERQVGVPVIDLHVVQGFAEAGEVAQGLGQGALVRGEADALLDVLLGHLDGEGVPVGDLAARLLDLHSPGVIVDLHDHVLLEIV
jgi:hypothetical protein